METDDSYDQFPSDIGAISYDIDILKKIRKEITILIRNSNPNTEIIYACEDKDELKVIKDELEKRGFSCEIKGKYQVGGGLGDCKICGRFLCWDQCDCFCDYDRLIILT